MSLLNSDFDITVEDLISCVIKKLLVYDGNIFGYSVIGAYMKSLPAFNEYEVPNVYIDGIDVRENEKCCIGCLYEPNSQDIHFKLFDPKYVSESYTFLEKGYAVDGYILLGKIRYYSFIRSEWGWINVNIDDLINGNLHLNNVITPSDVSEENMRRAIDKGEWVV
jgi:hypothetical protein